MYTKIVFIVVYVLVAAMFYWGGYRIAKMHTEVKFNGILEPFRSKDMAKAPRLLTDKSGKEYNGCNACGKKVWKPMRFCPYCAQRINWNFIRIKNTNFDAT